MNFFRFFLIVINQRKFLSFLLVALAIIYSNIEANYSNLAYANLTALLSNNVSDLLFFKNFSALNVILEYIISAFSGYSIWLCIGFIGSYSYSKIEIDVLSFFFRRLQRVPYEFFLLKDEGSFLKAIDSIIIISPKIYETFFLKLVSFCLVYTFALYRVFKDCASFAYILVGWSIFYLIAGIMLYKFISGTSAKQMETRKKVSGFVTENLKNKIIEEFFGTQEENFGALKQIQALFYKFNVKTIQSMELMTYFKYVCSMILTVISIFFLYGLPVSIAEKLKIFAVTRLLVHQFNHLSMDLPKLFDNIGKCRSAINFINETENFMTTKENIDIPHHFEGDIVIQNLTFYARENKLMDNLSIKIAPGKKVCVLGKSGSGKTTFLNIIAGLVRNYSGEVFINGFDIKNVNLLSLREHISYAFTSTYNLFDCNTIRNNLRVAKITATDNEIYEALKKAELYDIIYDLPEKLDSIMSSGARNFSSGQKTRLSLARAFLRQNAPINIFDEPAQGLDKHTAEKLIKTIFDFVGKNTLFITDHLGLALEYCDMVIVFLGDKILFGSHFDLLANKDYSLFVKNLKEKHECNFEHI